MDWILCLGMFLLAGVAFRSNRSFSEIHADMAKLESAQESLALQAKVIEQQLAELQCDYFTLQSSE